MFQSRPAEDLKQRGNVTLDIQSSGNFSRNFSTANASQVTVNINNYDMFSYPDNATLSATGNTSVFTGFRPSTPSNLNSQGTLSATFNMPPSRNSSFNLNVTTLPLAMGVIGGFPIIENTKKSNWFIPLRYTTNAPSYTIDDWLSKSTDPNTQSGNKLGTGSKN